MMTSFISKYMLFQGLQSKIHPDNVDISYLFLLSLSPSSPIHPPSSLLSTVVLNYLTPAPKYMAKKAISFKERVFIPFRQTIEKEL